MNEQIDEYTSRCNDVHFVDADVRVREFRDDRGMYYNTAVNYCHYTRFRLFLEEVRLIGQPICTEKPGPRCLHANERSALAMIGYLGDLIAAQNYRDEPFEPKVMFGRSTDTTYEFVDVPIFVVRRGEPLGGAAVVVQHDGTTYYIPRPDFGSPTEARSLQTLELVLQTVQAATSQKDLPKTVPSVAVVKQ